MELRCGLWNPYLESKGGPRLKLRTKSGQEARSLSEQCPCSDTEAMTCCGTRLQAVGQMCAVGQDTATFAHFLGLTGAWVRGRSSYRPDLCF